MSESEASETTNKDTKPETTARKRVRHRKKLLYEKILKQMEFYFSDANLSKDRYLGQLLQEEPYVPLDEFLKFNKIRLMTHEANDIAKAMKNSTLLELSDDRTKVKRKTAVQEYDADSRTVYVESIPATASREWLERVFRDYGPVAYISLPKFKDSQRIKGYGFVEFVKPEDAQKCLSVFTNMGCKLPTCTPAEELSSIKTFSVEAPPGVPAPAAAVPDASHLEYEPPKKKSKKPKERKPQLKQEPAVGAEPSVEEEEVRTATERSTDAESKYDSASQSEGTRPGDILRKKKRRKRSAKERSKARNAFSEKEAPKGALWGLQVLSKGEWKALRNKYLNLQRAHMQLVKRSLRAQHYVPPPAPPAATPAPAPPAAAPAGPEPVFVAVTLPEPCADVRDTKRRLKGSALVRHADVREGQSEAVLRFDSADAATEWVVSAGAGAGAGAGAAHVLPAPEQVAQRALWRRAQAARAQPGKLRGRQRLQARAAAAAAAPAPPQPSATHIRFDEDEAHPPHPASRLLEQ